IPGIGEGDDKNAIRAVLGTPSPDRLLAVAQALRLGMDKSQVHTTCRIDPWFLDQIQELVETEADIRRLGLPNSAALMRKLKAMGFSDARLGELTGKSEADVTAHRRALDVRPVYKRIDTSAAEFASPTAYMYSTYEAPFGAIPDNEAKPTDRRKVMILGGGPNRIGQGIEFDYCCCHAAFALEKIGIESIMVNCNPETVSTDYDTSDRLYFESLTAEDVIEIIHGEQQNGEFLGVIVQFGGQTPLKLAEALQEAGIPILGTSPDAIDLAEDRDRFKSMLQELGLKQPDNGIAHSVAEIGGIIENLGFPMVIRPSYVLGGRAMEIVHDSAGFNRYLEHTLPELVPPDVRQKFPNNREAQIDAVLVTNPLLFDSYLTDATEVDVDILADGKDVFTCGVLEHIEEAGIHSGDSACSLPPHSLPADLVAEMERQAKEMALALSVGGLMNVQFAIKDGEIYVIEVNPRASRTVPFVAKVIGAPIAQIAARVMCGETLASFNLKRQKLDHIAVKEAVFPFARFPGVDTVLGPEMRSTGEVMGLASDFPMAYGKSQLGAGARVPLSGTVFISVKDSDKKRFEPSSRALDKMGFKIIATGGTMRHLQAAGIDCTKINKVLEGRPHIVDAIKNGQVDLVINTTEGAQALTDSKSLREAALLHKIPYHTTLAAAVAATEAIQAFRAGPLEIAPLQAYLARNSAN
ncbi:MAG: carbamoyl-phosphate synthase large subunit, partial [Fimbriimonadaceae bacterium]|nr:carbamoyl-phosphate synthase large subunit [Alphaproteobacteria bacterium]